MAAAVHAGPASRDIAGAADRLPVPDPPRRPHDAPGVLAHHQALLQESRRRERTFTAYLAARFRDSSAEPRGGSARRANASGAQRSVDHADLHPRRPRALERSSFPAPPARLAGSSAHGRGICAVLLESREPPDSRKVEQSSSAGAPSMLRILAALTLAARAQNPAEPGQTPPSG